MKARYIIAGCLLLLSASCQLLGGGDRMPTVTRTGDVKDIYIREDVSPAALTANPGDEIRWINKRQGTVRVIFLSPVTEQLSCQRNFGGMLSANREQYTANLGSNDTASVCFKNPTEVKYVVRADSNLPSGEVNFSGTVTIGESQSRESTTSRRDGRAQADHDPTPR
jgi:plastocyanin